MQLRPVRRVAGVVILAITAAVACKKEEPFVPVATTVNVSPTSKAFHALTAQQQFTASVLDQRGNAMTTASVTWSTSAIGVAQVNVSGVVTATGAGSATITAISGTASGSAAVTVNQVPASLFKFDGDGQTGQTGQQLPLLITARVLDSASVAVPGVSVSFSAGSGGSVGSPTATTNGQGQASTTWTLGSGVGPQQLTVSSAGVAPVVFNATALAGAVDTVIKQTSDASNVPAGTAVSPAPAVLLQDASGNPVAGQTVTFAIMGGGGQLNGATQVSNASGIATVGSWIVGTSGPQTLRATVTGTGIGGNPVTFNATVLPPGAPDNVVIAAGNNQTNLQGYPVNVRPAVQVRDAANNPVQGVSVTFAVTGGGGSVTLPSQTTDLTGIARVGNWTIQSGANTMTANAAGIATPATFNATGVAQTFNIEVRFLTSVTPTQQAAFDSAAAKWSRIIFQDIPGFALNFPAASCSSPTMPAINETVDDIIIFAQLEFIDGPGMILGSAGPCHIRPTTGQTTYGRMRFDTADLPGLESAGLLQLVILHEMGHVLGLGTLWNTFSLLSGGGGADPFFTGAQARLAFDEIGGAGYTAGGKVPVENTGGGGTRDAHWRESVFANELMTGFISNGANPLSTVTAAQFGDLGYAFNLGAADTYTVPLTMSPAARAQTMTVHLVDDILHAPIVVSDESGRVIKVIQPK